MLLYLTIQELATNAFFEHHQDSDFPQHIPADRVLIAMGAEESDYSLGLLERLNDAAEKNPIKERYPNRIPREIIVVSPMTSLSWSAEVAFSAWTEFSVAKDTPIQDFPSLMLE